jgi:site-specific DNA-cytosine methylase
MAYTMIELFAGSGILANTFKENNYNTLTIGFKDKTEYKLDLEMNILDVDYDLLELIKASMGKVNVIFSGSPCECFSKLGAIHKTFIDGKPNYDNPKLVNAVAVHKKAIQIIEYFNPDIWFIENPSGFLQTMDFMKNIGWIYGLNMCMYNHQINGKYFKKPTQLWSNVGIFSFKRCENKYSKHVHGGIDSDILTEDRSIYPKEFCNDIVNKCTNYLEIYG